MRGFLTGLLLLTGLQAVVSRGSGRVGEGFTALATVINHVVSPNVPAIPDLRVGGDFAAPASSTTSTAPATAVPAATTVPAKPAATDGLTNTRPTVPPVHSVYT